LGVYRNPYSPQPLGSGQNHNYDDGFVRVDSTGNAGGTTWNWGNSNANQYDSAGGGTMPFSISNSLANGKASDEDDSAPGFEVFAYYDMGELPALNFGAGPARWGMKATFHYANIGIDNSGALGSGINTYTDSFDLDGVVPPQAPYTGSFNGPGPGLSDSPTRSDATYSNGATVTGNRDLDVNLFGLSVGPYLELPLTQRLTVNLEGGVGLAIVDGEYDFNSRTTIPGTGTQTNRGRASETRVIPGVSAGLTALYRVTDVWSAYAGARYQYYSQFEIDAGDSEAELDFGNAFILSLGAVYQY
jgi:hypothetical protein